MLGQMVGQVPRPPLGQMHRPVMSQPGMYMELQSGQSSLLPTPSNQLPNNMSQGMLQQVHVRTCTVYVCVVLCRGLYKGRRD